MSKRDFDNVLSCSVEIKTLTRGPKIREVLAKFSVAVTRRGTARLHHAGRKALPEFLPFSTNLRAGFPQCSGLCG